MKKIIAAALLGAVVSVGAASPVSARTAAKINVASHDSVSVRLGYAKVAGTVTAVSANAITVSADGQTWTVHANSNIVAEGGGRIALSEIAVDHRVWAVGRVTASTSAPQGGMIDASLIKDLSLERKRVSLRGIISDLNAGLRSFTLTTKKGAEVNVVVNADADIEVKNSTSSSATSSFANLANGMMVKVKGLFTTSTSGTTTVRSVAATDVKAWANATSTHSTSSASIRLDLKERWEDWKERWEERHDDDRGRGNDKSQREEARLRILERVDERIGAGILLGR